MVTAPQVRAYPPRPDGDADRRRAAVRTRKDRSYPVETNSRWVGIYDRDSEDKRRQAHKQTGLPMAADRRREMRTDLRFGPGGHRREAPRLCERQNAIIQDQESDF